MNGAQLLRSLALRQGRPMGVHLQVADRCNHACHHCYQVQGEKGELGLDALRSVIDGIADAGVFTLNVSGGEPTLRPDLFDILRYARGRGFALRLFTNAFLIDEAYAEELARIGLLEVHVSLYSGVAEEHDAVTRVPRSFERTVGAVAALRERGVRVVLKTPATTLSPLGARGVEALALRLGCDHQASTDLSMREDGAADPWAVRVTPEDLLRQGMLSPWSPSDDEARARAAKLAAYPCGVGRSGLVVLPDGRLQACSDTPNVLADLTQKPLAEALETSPERELFEGLTWSRVHGCRDCDLLAACQRCHATALHEGGDYLGPYPSACARARARYAAAAGSLEVTGPSADCEPGRDPAVGPYSILAPGVIRPARDVRTAEDEALAARFVWLRGEGAKPVGAGLVSIRRKPAAASLQSPAAEPCSVPQVERV
jgi:radical SAM protein with 4Fe4S-binding SPASM domain